MANLSKEQIEQKKLLLAEKMKEAKALYDELVAAGTIELSEKDLDNVAGGGCNVTGCSAEDLLGIRKPLTPPGSMTGGPTYSPDPEPVFL